MPYICVRGSIQLSYTRNGRRSGSQPDGDSTWFKPDNENTLNKIPRIGTPNKGGFMQLRYEAIDALETHYKGGHQAIPECTDARDHLLRKAGFTNVQYGGNQTPKSTVRSSTPTSVRAHILTRGAGPHGRPISFVFVGNPPEADGDENVYLEAPRTRTSLNAEMLRSGQAYPLYYSSLPVDLRDSLTGLADSAWSSSRGVWSSDDSLGWTRVRDRNELDSRVMWPKLYRRLAAYFRDGNTGLAGFDGWLRADPHRDDQLWIASRAEHGNLHDVVETNNDRIRLLYWPEDLITIPR